MEPLKGCTVVSITSGDAISGNVLVAMVLTDTSGDRHVLGPLSGHNTGHRAAEIASALATLGAVWYRGHVINSGQIRYEVADPFWRPCEPPAGAPDNRCEVPDFVGEKKAAAR